MSNQEASSILRKPEGQAESPTAAGPDQPPDAFRVPLVWALFGHNTGDNSQLRLLADAIGWPYEKKQMRWEDPVSERELALKNANWRSAEPRFDRDLSSPLGPPWPDLVISADILCSWVAIWIRRQAGPKTKLVRLGNPRGPVSTFDLLITPPQFAVPPRPNVFHLPEPIVFLDKERMAAAAAAWAPRLQHLPRPWRALLVGGQIKQYPFDEAAGRLLVRRMNDLAREQGGSVLVSTSRRTPPAVAAVIEAELAEPRFLHRWNAANPDNPYLAFLALADSIIVTADSATMLSEACATRKPVYIYRPKEPFRTGFLKRKIMGALAQYLGRSRPGSFRMNWIDRLHDRLHDENRVRYNRDLSHLHRVMIECGAAAPLDGKKSRPARVERPSLPAALAEAAARIRALMIDSAPHDRP